MKWQDTQLPDPTGPLSFIIPAEAIRDANDAHIITWSGAAASLARVPFQWAGCARLIITTDRVNKSGWCEGGKCKHSRDS